MRQTYQNRYVTASAIAVLFLILPVVAHAQSLTFTPNCNGTSDTAAFAAILSTIGGNTGTIRLPYKGSIRCAIGGGGTLTIPANITLNNEDGTGLTVQVGTTLVIQGPIVAPPKLLFNNALAGQGTVSITSYAVQEVYPEWWGASPSASAAVNTPALQAALKGSGTGHSNLSGQTIYNRILKFSGMYQINAALIANSTIGFNWQGNSKFNSGIQQMTANTKIIDADGVAYGTFNELRFTTSVVQANNALIDLYKQSNPDLSPQNITFTNCLFQGNSVALMAVWIARPGGGSQGDSMKFISCVAAGFTHSVVSLGGNNTAPLLNSSYAQNAINAVWEGGGIDSCPNYGLASYGGSWLVRDVLFTNGNISNINSPPGALQTGYDLHSEAPIFSNSVENVRSESLRFADGPWRIKNCELLGPDLTWTLPWSGLPGTNSFEGQLITGSLIGGDGKMYLVGPPPGTTAYRDITSPFSTTVVTDPTASYGINALAGQKIQIKYPNCFSNVYSTITSNTATTITVSPALTFTPGDVSPAQTCGATTQYRTFPAFPVFGGLGDSIATGGSLTTIVQSSATWTVNAFVGQRVSIVSGTGVGLYAVITSNTSDTITHAGWVTDYIQYGDVDFVIPVSPTSSSHFVVEPNWGANPTTSGNVVFALFDVLALSGSAGSPTAGFVIDGFKAGLGTRLAIDNTSRITDLEVTRTDWQSEDLNINDRNLSPRIERVLVRRREPGGAASDLVPWRLRRVVALQPAYAFFDNSQSFRSSEWLIWGAHSLNDSSPYRDVGIGRGGGINNAVGSAVSQNVLGYLGMLGRRTAYGTDVAGTSTQIQGGLSTGTGAPGALEFWLGSVGASGTQVNPGTKAVWIDPLGLHVQSTTFGALGTPAAPTIIWCSNCNVATPCTGSSGTGAYAFRTGSGTWACPF